MLKIPCARDSRGVMRFPTEATKADGPFTCYGCALPLVVYKGAQRAHHFQHVGGSLCGGGGETMLHRSTKEWVAFNVDNPALVITALCPGCKTAHTVFGGRPDLTATTECGSTIFGRKYQIDVSVFLGALPFADVEVVHTHACDERKRLDLALCSRLGCLEVAAINLAEHEFPMSLKSVGRQPRCRTCAAASVGRRRQQAALGCIAAWARRVLPAWRRKRRLARSAAAAWKFAVQQSSLLRQDSATREQLALAPHRGVVNAPAGGGKTSMILAMAVSCPRALLVTFNKDLATATSARAGPNLVVKTFDAVCHSFTGVAGGLPDAAVVKVAYPKCKPWFRKRGAVGMAKVTTAILEQCSVVPCAYHADVMYGIRRGATVDSFARSRNLVESRKVDIAAGYDHLFVDEYQDMTPQALRIIAHSATPTTLVGDVNQKIYAFSSDLHCDCTITHPGPVPLGDVVQLQQTFRSPTSVVRLMCSVGIRCATATLRRGGFLQCPMSALPFLCTATATCVIARSNQSVYAAATSLVRYGLCVTVIGGSKIAAEVQSCVRAGNRRSRNPLQRWVTSMSRPDDIMEFLRAHDGPFGTAGVAVVTVHRAKGSEHRHVILYDEIDRDDEPEVWYVAHTRHTHTLIQLTA